MKIKSVGWFNNDEFYDFWKPFRSNLERLVEKHLAEITELFDFIYHFGKGSDVITIKFRLGELNDRDFVIELFNERLDGISWVGWLEEESTDWGVAVFYFESEQGEVEKNEKNNDAASEKSA